jgi:hypothetical protein
MTSSREADFFRIDLEETTVLLPASDFASAASSDFFKIGRDIAVGLPVVVYRGKNYPCVNLERVFAFVFGINPPAEEGVSATVFFRMLEDTRVPDLYSGSVSPGECAFLLERSFSMVSMPLSDFRLPPAGIRHRLNEAGIRAFRFVPGSRPAFVIDVRKFYPMPLGMNEVKK